MDVRSRPEIRDVWRLPARAEVDLLRGAKAEPVARGLAADVRKALGTGD